MWLTKTNAKTNMLRSDIVILLLTISYLPTTTWALSDKRLCADPKCEQIISTGIAKISYAAGGEGLLSFKINTPVRVLSKSAGSDMQLWGVEINGRRGYANKNFILEKKVYISEKALAFEVPVISKSQAALPASIEQVATANGEVKIEPAHQHPPTIQANSEAVKPKEVLEPLSGSNQQPLLNASEASTDVLTTTTSPLEVNVEVDKPAILTENEKLLTKEEVPVQTTPVKPLNVQLVDGTALPEEFEPATTESQLKQATAANETNADVKQNETFIDIEMEDDFDYEEDEEIDDLGLDSEDNEKLNEIANDKMSPKINNDKAPTIETVVKPIEQKDTKTVHLNEMSTEDKLPNIPSETQKSQPQETAETVPQQPLGEDPLPLAAGKGEAKIEDKITYTIVNQSVETTESTTSAQQTKSAEPTSNLDIEEKIVKSTAEQTVQPAAPIIHQRVETKKEVFPIIEEIVQPAPKLKDDKLLLNIGDNDINLEQIGAKEQAQQNLNAPKEPQKSNEQDIELSRTVAENEVEEVLKLVEVAPENQEQVAPIVVEIPSTAPPIEAVISEQPTGLPPLFNKQQFENPNDYYRSLQQQQLAKDTHQEAPQQEKEIHDEEKQPESKTNDEQNHTTPGYDMPYDELYDYGTTTPAPVVDPEIRVKEESIRKEAASTEPVVLPSTSTPIQNEETETVKAHVDSPGLFSTIMGTVNNFISSRNKEPETELLRGDSDELQRILYSDASVRPAADAEYCTRPQSTECRCPSGSSSSTVSIDIFVEDLTSKLLEHGQLLLCVVVAAISSLFFMFGYYCFCNSSQEGALLSKLNLLERSLLTAHKENLILKHDLTATRTKLSSIEDNSFGSNDMVASLKKQLETELLEKGKLQEQVISLEKDVENAAEAGLELNKILSEVLNNQNGDEAFMTTVDQLQRQLNDQEKIIIDINSRLAEKSRENSELQYSFTESTTRLASEMKTLQQDNYELEMEKAKLQTRVEEVEALAQDELAKSLEARNYEMQKLQNQILDLTAKWEKENGDLQTSQAKIEALEESLRVVKKDGNVQDLIKSANTRGELNATKKKFTAMQAKLELEFAAKTSLESQLQQASKDVEQLKQNFNQAERDKLEAQTRLEVLSSYFREKETELQKELSLQEAKWLQHQGENASTVETQTLMKNEIQTLKSQNDELRAEIEAQLASHKAQIGTLENRAHESWLALRQSERRCEEALNEAAALRRKLTILGTGGGTLDQASNNSAAEVPLSAEMKNAPSPLPLPGSPLLSMPNQLTGSPLLNMPNPLPFLPFSPFMGLPPPPFLNPGQRPPPLGHIRSMPPSNSSRGDRYSPHRDDYSDDYDDYEDDDEDDRLPRHRRHSGSWGRNDSYMHSPRTYRSLSPSDSRYNYIDTETDFSPPPSPSPAKRNNNPRTVSEV